MHIYMGYNFTVDFFSVSENIGPKSVFFGENRKIPKGPLRVFPNIRDGPFLIIYTVHKLFVRSYNRFRDLEELQSLTLIFKLE